MLETRNGERSKKLLEATSLAPLARACRSNRAAFTANSSLEQDRASARLDLTLVIWRVRWWVGRPLKLPHGPYHGSYSDSTLLKYWAVGLQRAPPPHAGVQTKVATYLPRSPRSLSRAKIIVRSRLKLLELACRALAGLFQSRVFTWITQLTDLVIIILY